MKNYFYSLCLLALQSNHNHYLSVGTNYFLGL
jgi:hypothetical protein